MVNEYDRNKKDWWWKQLPVNSSSCKEKHIKIPSAWEAGAVSTTKNSFVIYLLFMDFYIIKSVEHHSETLLQAGISWCSTPCQVTVTLLGQVLKILMDEEVHCLVPSPLPHWLLMKTFFLMSSPNLPNHSLCQANYYYGWMKTCANTRRVRLLSDTYWVYG